MVFIPEPVYPLHVSLLYAAVESFQLVSQIESVIFYLCKKESIRERKYLILQYGFITK